MKCQEERGGEKIPNTKTKDSFCLMVLILAGEVQLAVLHADCQKQKHVELKLKGY